MPRGIPIKLREVERACDHYAQWGSWSAAAKHVGLSYNGLLKALNETWPERREDAENRYRDRIRKERVERAFQRDDRDSWKFLQSLAAENLPETREVLMRQRVELTGANGGPLEVTNPDVAAALDRFTATIRRLAERHADPALPGGDVRELAPGGAGELVGGAG